MLQRRTGLKFGALALAASVLAGCGGKSTDNEPKSPAQVQQSAQQRAADLAAQHQQGGQGGAQSSGTQ